jgi:outer membrane lipoprotein-sorting protein
MTATQTVDGPVARTLAVAFALLLVVSTAGCADLTGVTDADRELPDRAEAVERTESLETLTATVTTVRRVDGTTTRSVAENAHRTDPNGFRSRIVSVDAPGERGSSVGTVTVSNTSGTAFYRPDENTLTYLLGPGNRNADDGGASPYVDMIVAARTNESIPRPTAGVPSLPRVPNASDDAGNDSATYRDYRVTVAYNGTETVDGRETYRLEVDPVSPNAALKDQTVWLDTEYLYPLEQRVEFVLDGDRYEYRTIHRNVTFNPALPPDTFELDTAELPDDVEVTVFRAYESRQGLAANVSLPVPDPELPDGYVLDRATYRDDDPAAVTLSYKARDDERPIRIWVIEENGSATTAPNGTVRIGDDNATVSAYDGVTQLSWYADGYGYTVSGPVDEETLTRVARSVAESVDGEGNDG